MFPSRKFCSFFSTPFSFRMRRPFFLFFCSIFLCFLCWPEKLENQLWFSCFFTCSFFCCFRIPYSVFFAAQQATRLFVFVALFCFILLCSLYLPPAVFPHFLYYHAIYHFLCQTLAHSARRPTPTRALFVFRHIPAMFRERGGYLLYTEHIIYS